MIHYVTTKRLTDGRKSANGTSYVHQTSSSLYPLNWQGAGWELGSTVSRLQGRNIGIMMTDQDVTSVTSLMEV